MTVLRCVIGLIIRSFRRLTFQIDSAINFFQKSTMSNTHMGSVLSAYQFCTCVCVCSFAGEILIYSQAVN